MRRPKATAGLLLVETPAAITNPPADLAALLKCDAPTNIERRDYVQVEHAAWDHRRRIGDIPVIVISNDFGSSAADKGERRNVVTQQAWLELDSSG